MADQAAAYVRESVICGNSFQRQYTLKSGDDPVDLTGYIVRWTSYWGDNSIIKTTADDSLSMPDPTDGTVSLSLTPTETRLVPVNDFMRYQLEIISGDNIQTTVLYGDIWGDPGGSNID